MGSLSLSAIASLDHSLALLSESLENLKAARSVEMAEVVEQLKVAAESAHTVCELVWSELPEASWQTRQELDALIDQIQKISKTRTLEQQRSRLLALAAELERGSIVHRRALRVSEVSQLRKQAINELRAQAVSETPPTLPGPAAEQWVNWACGLQEPQDAECLRILQSGFARVDDLVANLEPDMWQGGGSPPVEILAGAERTVDTKRSEASRRETRGFEEPLASSTLPEIETKASESPSRNDKSLSPDVLHEHDPRAFESNTLTPQDATPRRGEEASQQVTAQERALLAGMMGLINDPAGHFSPQVGGPLTAALFRATSAVEPAVASNAVAHFSPPVERPHTAEVPRGTEAALAAVSDPVSRFDPRIESVIEFPVKEKAAVVAADGDPVGHFGRPVASLFPKTSTAAAVPSETRTKAEGLWVRKPRMLVVVAGVLVLAAPAIILWRSWAAARRSDTRHAGVGPIITLERKAPDLRPGNPQVKVLSQLGMPADFVMHTPSAKTLTKEELKHGSVTPKSVSKAPLAKQANGRMAEVSRRLVATSRNSITVMKEEAPSSSTAEMAPSISNMLPNGVLGNLPSVLRDVPVARPTIASEGRLRVSSGVAQGLLVRQVAPRYPQQAVQAHVEGTVVLQAVIGKDGRVQNVHALSGNPMLIPAAIDAVSRWRYKPYQLNGEPVEADTQINVKFMLSGQ